MAPIQLTVQRPDFDTVHVTLQGSLDLARAYEFDEAIRRIERDAPGRVLVDLRALDFLDTTGLSRLVALRRRCRRTGAGSCSCAGSQAVQRLFAVTAMNEHFEVVGDPEESAATAERREPPARRRPRAVRRATSAQSKRATCSEASVTRR